MKKCRKSRRQNFLHFFIESHSVVHLFDIIPPFHKRVNLIYLFKSNHPLVSVDAVGMLCHSLLSVTFTVVLR